ncbi:MAG: RNA-dependent DNA polymerase, partial [Chloroflexi bacterium]
STFIHDSFSCRIGKGNHAGMKRLEVMTRKVSKNYTCPCFVLKCDIKKFFDSVDHEILLNLLTRRISCPNTIWLLREVVGSFSVSETLFEKQGLPIGNLTSQLFANVYMNELDQFMKHKLRVKYYARYTDDFVVVADSTDYLELLLSPIADFLAEHLKIKLHPDKTSIRTLLSGVDFLGYVIRPHYRVIRVKTRKRSFKKMKRCIKTYEQGEISKETLEQSLHSYLGAMSHGCEYKTSENLKNLFWLYI